VEQQKFVFYFKQNLSQDIIDDGVRIRRGGGAELVECFCQIIPDAMGINHTGKTS